MTDRPANPFRPELFAFLRDLAANNERAYFQANKTRYERHVRDPALQWISDFGPRLRKISRHFEAIPKASGGSLFRIYRDTRFARDKRPYKTHTGIHFRHRQARDAHAPGFYLHLEPGQVFVGAGIWHPDAATLRRIRQHLVAQPAAWRRLWRDQRLGALELAGDSLKRPPRGFDPDHPLIEDLKRKDFIAVAMLDEETALADDFLDRFTALCSAASPLVRFLCRALEVPF